MINQTAKNFIRHDYSVVQCLNCAAYYIDPLIDFTLEEWKQLYSSEYFEYASEWLVKQREKDLNYRFAVIDNYVKKGNVNFLDIGCGEGNALLKAHKRGWNLNAVDISDLRNSEAKNNTAINFIESALPEAKLPENTYDVIYLDSVLEHVLNPLEYLTEIKRILAPGGIVYIGVPNEDALMNEVRKFAFILKGRKGLSTRLRPFDSPYHVVGFNYNSMNLIIDKAGLSKVYFRNFGRKFDFLGFKPGSFDFWQSLVTLPFEFIGALSKKDIYFEMILKKSY
ncbi:MAG: class I SAM-dependent methyltransferase [Ignavibacteriaceae bacterium]|nr:class I SAM-dependent methyltransferase [Ignavibacteriaceae bacterium]